MSRYIDADKLQEEFKELHGGKRLLLIDTEPTADVVEVVRCKDCKYRDTMPDYEYDDDHEHRTLMGTDFCRWWHDESPNDDDYCSFGERSDCRTTNTWAVAPSDDWFCADGERAEE